MRLEDLALNGGWRRRRVEQERGKKAKSHARTDGASAEPRRRVIRRAAKRLRARPLRGETVAPGSQKSTTVDYKKPLWLELPLAEFANPFDHPKHRPNQA